MSTVRPYSEEALGADAWQQLHADAHTAGRRPQAQLIVWLRYAAKARLEGRNLELSPAQIARLLGRLESVA
jgi:hypothetical protein